MKILVAYDGTLHAKKALAYGIRKAAAAGGELIVLHVFDPGLFIDYDAGPQAEALARKESAAHLEEVAQRIRQGSNAAQVTLLSEEGNAVKLVQDRVQQDRPDLLLLPPRFKAAARSVDVPVFHVPGTILVPVDGSGRGVAPETALHEALLTGSKLMVLGVVPVHLYSREEKKELEQVRRSTRAAMTRFRRALHGKNVDIAEILREGYPDEEILRAANETAASLVLLPSGSTVPSELTKAALMLTGDPLRMHCPVELVPEGALA